MGLKIEAGIAQGDYSWPNITNEKNRDLPTVERNPAGEGHDGGLESAL